MMMLRLKLTPVSSITKTNFLLLKYEDFLFTNVMLNESLYVMF